MKVVSKRYVGLRHVYDITVSNTHTFIVSGLVSHNCHSYRIANYLKRHVKDKRLLFHTSENREQTLEKHIMSKKPTVLVTPSMTEGIDLKDDLSRWQVICKVPFPYLGDRITRKRMSKHKWWYGYETVKTIVQALGRSVRSDTDHAVTYILDEDFSRVYAQNRRYFPSDFDEVLQR